MLLLISRLKSSEMATQLSKIKLSLQEFCQATSLHGYSYLFNSKSWIVRLLWVMVIIAMTGIGFEFFAISLETYMRSGIVTTIDSATSPLEVGSLLNIAF